MQATRTHKAVGIPRTALAMAALATLAFGAAATAADAPRPGAGARAPLLKVAARTSAQEATSLRAGSASIAPKVTLSEGKSTLMRLPYPATRISVGNAKVADVILLNPTELYMLGKSVGSTNLILWNKAGEATIVDIAVDLDTSGLAARFEQLLAGEKDVKITAAGDSVILSGVVSDAVKLDQRGGQAGGRGAADAPGGAAAGGASAAGGGQGRIKVINMVSVAAPQQVMLEVKVAEISKTLIDQLGVSIGASRTNGSWTYSFLSNLLSGNPSAFDAFNSRNGNFLTIDAQKRDGLVKVLAEPTIMAISGQEASFLAGGKIFIPVSQTQSNGIPTITLEEKEFGVAVKFTPTVLEGGRINLKVAPEVSDLNKEGVGITATGISTTAILPSFTTRRATTTVQLYNGQSFAIGGLIKNNVTTNVKAFPMLGEIPVLGALFRSSEFQTDRSELVFIITPHLVKPLPADYKLPTDNYVEPSRSEFFLGGRNEGKPRTEAPPATTTASASSGFDLK